MLLCLDCGNTRLKWGLHTGAKLHAKARSIALNNPWLAQGALPIEEAHRLSTVLTDICATQLADQTHKKLQIKRIIACSVTHPKARETITSSLAPFNAPLDWLHSQALQCGVRNLYLEPEQLGVDRWAALIAAHHLHRGSALVVNAGTATTIDLLDAEGVFQGGLILPGLNMMRQALAQNTAQLPLVAGDFQSRPRNTRDAIISGCLQATVGAIERMFVQLPATANPMCLISGGAASAIAPYLTMHLRQIDNLVLEGLAQIALSEPTTPTTVCVE